MMDFEEVVKSCPQRPSSPLPSLTDARSTSARCPGAKGPLQTNTIPSRDRQSRDHDVQDKNFSKSFNGGKDYILPPGKTTCQKGGCHLYENRLMNFLDELAQL